MSAFFLLPCVFILSIPSESESSQSLTYRREAAGRSLPECEVITTASEQGLLYVSRSARSKDDTTTFTLRYDVKNQLKSADVVREVGKAKQTASVTLQSGGRGQLRRGSVTEFVRLPDHPVVTLAAESNDVAPSDVFQLLLSYDPRHAGKQEFPGISLHPNPGPGPSMQAPRFSIERVGDDRIALNSKEVKLVRYRVRLRQADYLAWADSSGLLCKLLRLDPKAPLLIVLKGYEEATRELGS
jgi:hypothetical protein